jgi:hypothetical protein
MFFGSKRTEIHATTEQRSVIMVAKNGIERRTRCPRGRRKTATITHESRTTMDVEVDIDGKIALSEEGEASSASQEQLDDEKHGTVDVAAAEVSGDENKQMTELVATTSSSNQREDNEDAGPATSETPGKKLDESPDEKDSRDADGPDGADAARIKSGK